MVKKDNKKDIKIEGNNEAAKSALANDIENKEVKKVDQLVMGLLHDDELSKNLHNILNDMGAGIWIWDIQFNREFWSEKLYEIFGYRPDKVTTNHENFLDFVHPDDQTAWVGALKKHLNEGAPFKIEVRLLHGDGKFRWFIAYGHATLNKDGVPVKMAGAIIDIQEEKLREQEKRRHEVLLKEAGRTAKLGAWEIDLCLKTLFWSDEVYIIHEIPSENKIALENAIDFYHDDYKEMVKLAARKCIEEGINWDLECKLITGKGREIWVRSTGMPITDSKGTCIGIRGVFQDIDEKKNRELDLKKTLKMLQKQNDRLLDFAYIVSHNLRSHTSNLKGIFNTLSMCEEEEKEVLLGHINETADKLGETIEHLGEVVKIQSSVDVVKEVVSVSKVYQRINGQLANVIKSSGVEIQTEFLVDEFLFVKTYFDSILQNLLSNAINFRDNSRPLKVYLKTFRSEETGQMVLSCSDNGTGIDLKRHGHKIFSMYKTFDKDRSSRGVGLFMVKNQIEAFGGSIEVESQIGEGASFRVYF